jgi:hypothetical protein
MKHKILVLFTEKPTSSFFFQTVEHDPSSKSFLGRNYNIFRTNAAQFYGINATDRNLLGYFKKLKKNVSLWPSR